MKFFFFFFLLSWNIIQINVYSQSSLNRFVLHGKVKGILNNTKIYFSGLDKVKNFKLDTNCVIVSDGQFVFKGKLTTPIAFKLQYIDSSGGYSSSLMILDKGYQEIEFSKDSFLQKTFVIKGSPINSILINEYLPLLKEYNYLLNDWYLRMNNLYHKYEGIDLEKKREQLKYDLKNRIEPIKDTALFNFTKNRKEYVLSLWLLLNELISNGYKEIYNRTLNLIPPKNLQTNLGIHVQSILQNFKRTAISQYVPNLKVYTLNKKSIDLGTDSYKKSSYTLIDFWFAHCGACIRQFPILDSIIKSFPSEYFNIISITVDNKESINEAIDIFKKYNLKWELLWDIGGKETMNLISNSFPSNLLVNKDGIILFKNIEPENLKFFLETKKI